jgi:ABC-type uncharacterized transport system fused permease/ATPase subunit
MTWTIGFIIYVVVSFILGVIIGRAIHNINEDK